MDNEPYRDFTHSDVIAGIVEYCHALGGHVQVECPMPDGKRADVCWVDCFDNVHIFEAKIFYRESYARQAYSKYYRWCNYLYLAVPHLTMQQWGMLRLQGCWDTSANRVGMLTLNLDGTHILHEPHYHLVLAENRERVIRAVR